MNRHLLPWAVAAISAVVLLAGCRREKREPFSIFDEPGQTTISSARAPIANETAMARLVASRCDRETECANIGPDKHYADRDVCRHEISTALRSDLGASKCPRGISAQQLDSCLVAIQRESCNNAFDTIARLTACRTADLCLNADEN